MNVFIRLTLITILFIAFLGLYFEFCVNRPLNIYLQYAAGAVAVIVSALFLTYMVKQIIKLLNP